MKYSDIKPKMMINEVQYVLKNVQGFTVTLGMVEDPNQEVQLNLADKKVDMSGPGGMVTVTESNPATVVNGKC